MKPDEAGAPGGDPIVREVARMVAEWETSDEQPTEFAERIVAYVRSRLAITS